jgi:protein-disulfide isomerase
VRLVYKHFPLDDRHRRRGVAEAKLVCAAAEQVLEFHDAVYASPPDGSESMISGLATKAGLDMKRSASACRRQGERERANADRGGRAQRRGRHAGVLRERTVPVGRGAARHVHAVVDEELETAKTVR